MNEQARKPEREAVLWSAWKHVESHRNDVAPFIGSNNDDNNDPCIERSVHVKSSLIDLEAYSESHGDKAEGVSHRERLSEETSEEDATVRSLLRKAMKQTEMICSLFRGVTTWLRHTAGCSLTDRANTKSWVIDLEACDYALAA